MTNADIGKLLISSPVLQDSNFQRTVVLLCAHDDEGSMGLVLNRPTLYSLCEALSGVPETATQRLFWGGPVQAHMVLVLHRSGVDYPNARLIADGMRLGGDSDSLLHILGTTPEPESRIRVFAGYAGWAPGQLRAEMSQKSWIVAETNAQFVFSTNPDSMWSTALERLGPDFAHLATMPLDPRVN